MQPWRTNAERTFLATAAAGCPRPPPGTARTPASAPARRSRGQASNPAARPAPRSPRPRSEEHTSELQSLMRISYAVFCLKKKNTETETITKQIDQQHLYRQRLHYKTT